MTQKWPLTNLATSKNVWEKAELFKLWSPVAEKEDKWDWGVGGKVEIVFPEDTFKLAKNIVTWM